MMKKLSEPLHTAKNTFLTCISRVANQPLKQRLENAADEIETIESDFSSNIINVIPPSINDYEFAINAITKDEMIAIYENRMVPKESPGRHIYDEIYLAPSFGVCPFCGHRNVASLDHYFPKSKFPALAVTPINLVPSCSDCNKIKSWSLPNTQEELPFHPYFDDFETDRWLNATLVTDLPIAITFNVQRPHTWDYLTFVRASNHFSALELGKLYASQASTELLNIQYNLNNLHINGGSDAVRDHLTEAYLSRETVRLNSWQTATYRTLSSSDWFCNGGFNNI